MCVWWWEGELNNDMRWIGAFCEYQEWRELNDWQLIIFFRAFFWKNLERSHVRSTYKVTDRDWWVRKYNKRGKRNLNPLVSVKCYLPMCHATLVLLLLLLLRHLISFPTHTTTMRPMRSNINHSVFVGCVVPVNCLTLIHCPEWVSYCKRGSCDDEEIKRVEKHARDRLREGDSRTRSLLHNDAAHNLFV